MKKLLSRQEATSRLKRLEQVKDTYEGYAATLKLKLLQELQEARLPRAEEVGRLHEILCFLHAYPDSRDILKQVRIMLGSFDKRRDLRDHRQELVNSGIAGTEIRFPFFWFTAYWLARRWPDHLSINWADFDKKGKLEDFLHLLLPYSETPALDSLSFSPREWIHQLKGPHETDATFLIRRFKKLAASSFGRETLFESFDIPIRISPGPDTPNRTCARYPGSSVAFQIRPLSSERPSLRDEIKRCRISVQSVTPGEARKLITLARESMVTRSRDLDVFEHASEKDVRLMDCGRGLQFVCIGAVPERRLMLEAVYGFLTLKNGVPTGYVLVGSLFNTAEIAYNVFDTYRVAESAFVYSRVLVMAHHLFGCDTIVVPPPQLGHNNPEGLKSGAWWFYYKLKFRPQDREVRAILRGELKKMKRDPRHRSSIATLNKLASENMYLYLKKPRKDVLGEVSLGEVGLRISRTLADRFGADREKGIKICSKEAARMLGMRSMGRFSAGEKLAWERWSPLIMSIRGVQDWRPSDKRALIQVVRAKGGQRESRFVRLFDNHRRLRKAILKLSQEV